MALLFISSILFCCLGKAYNRLKFIKKFMNELKDVLEIEAEFNPLLSFKVDNDGLFVRANFLTEKEKEFIHESQIYKNGTKIYEKVYKNNEILDIKIVNMNKFEPYENECGSLKLEGDMIIPILVIHL